jgi:Type-IV b secretion system, inner-membrane complex component
MTVSQFVQRQTTSKPLPKILFGIVMALFQLVIINPLVQAGPSISSPPDATSSRKPAPTLPQSKAEPDKLEATIARSPEEATSAASPNTSTPVNAELRERNLRTIQVNVNMPLSQSNVTDSEVETFAIDVAKSAYSYDFKNYPKQIPTNQQYFTEAGWTAFVTALDKSNNLKILENRKLVASATSTGKAKVVKKEVKNGTFTWQVQLPLLVTYENESKLIKQTLIVTLLISRTHSPTNLGVSHFVAAIAPITQPITTPPSLTTSSPTTKVPENTPDPLPAVSPSSIPAVPPADIAAKPTTQNPDTSD